jgi:aminopeptidase N
LTTNFVLSHLPQVTPLVDLSASSRYVAQLANGSGDPRLVPKLQAYAAAHLKPQDRRPVDRAIGRIQWKASNKARIQRELVDWLKSHPTGQAG